MKQLYTLLIAVLFSVSIFAQSTENMSYQAVLRDADNNLVANQSVKMQISILHGSATGSQVYMETHTPTTNINGLVSIEIGGGIVVSNDYSAIDWANGPYFIKTETDLDGGTNYTITATSQLLAVPYALHAKAAEKVTSIKTYSVGDFAQGGIVFYVDETGVHGLVCAKVDQSASENYWVGAQELLAGNDGLYAGKINTIMIMTSMQNYNLSDETWAGRICGQLQITEDGETYGDWYLPSKYELNLMYENRGLINNTAALNGGTWLNTGNYWSSTSKIKGEAWLQNFSDGEQYNVVGGGHHRVRAIRAF